MEAAAWPGAQTGSMQIPLAQPNNHNLKTPNFWRLTSHKDLKKKNKIKITSQTFKTKRKQGNINTNSKRSLSKLHLLTPQKYQALGCTRNIRLSQSHL